MLAISLGCLSPSLRDLQYFQKAAKFKAANRSTLFKADISLVQHANGIANHTPPERQKSGDTHHPHPSV